MTRHESDTPFFTIFFTHYTDDSSKLVTRD